jgi:hypothetical protein
MYKRKCFALIINDVFYNYNLNGTGSLSGIYTAGNGDGEEMSLASVRWDHRGNFFRRGDKHEELLIPGREFSIAITSPDGIGRNICWYKQNIES